MRKQERQFLVERILKMLKRSPCTTRQLSIGLGHKYDCLHSLLLRLEKKGIVIGIRRHSMASDAGRVVWSCPK